MPVRDLSSFPGSLLREIRPWCHPPLSVPLGPFFLFPPGRLFSCLLMDLADSSPGFVAMRPADFHYFVISEGPLLPGWFFLLSKEFFHRTSCGRSDATSPPPSCFFALVRGACSLGGHPGLRRGSSQLLFPFCFMASLTSCRSGLPSSG